jgi:hypothetical protein
MCHRVVRPVPSSGRGVLSIHTARRRGEDFRLVYPPYYRTFRGPMPAPLRPTPGQCTEPSRRETRLSWTWRPGQASADATASPPSVVGIVPDIWRAKAVGARELRRVASSEGCCDLSRAGLGYSSACEATAMGARHGAAMNSDAFDQLARRMGATPSRRGSCAPLQRAWLRPWQAHSSRELRRMVRSLSRR